MASVKEEASRRSRQRLIEAATDLFSRQGYQNTSVDEIAAAAGISRGSIFWHFESKAGLLLAVVDCAFARWLDYWNQAQHPDALRPALASMIEVFRAWSRDPCARLMPMLLFESLRDGSPLRESYAERYQMFRQHFAAWAEHHRDESWPENLSPDRFAMVVWGALIGMHLQWRLDPDRVDFDAGMLALESMLARLEREEVATEATGTAAPARPTRDEVLR
jgi:AcrR family transcriptional regulator